VVFGKGKVGDLDLRSGKEVASLTYLALISIMLYTKSECTTGLPAHVSITGNQDEKGKIRIFNTHKDIFSTPNAFSGTLALLCFTTGL
jgi:hypothetical protein